MTGFAYQSDIVDRIRWIFVLIFLVQINVDCGYLLGVFKISHVDRPKIQLHRKRLLMMGHVGQILDAVAVAGRG